MNNNLWPDIDFSERETVMSILDAQSYFLKSTTKGKLELEQIKSFNNEGILSIDVSLCLFIDTHMRRFELFYVGVDMIKSKYTVTYDINNNHESNNLENFKEDLQRVLSLPEVKNMVETLYAMAD